MKDSFLLALGFIAVIVVGIVSLMLIPDIHAGIIVFFQEVNNALVITFGTGLTLTSAAVVVKIWKMASTHEVKDGKDGRVARAIVYKGKITQIGSAEGIGLNELLQMQMQLINQQEKTLRVVDSGAKTIQHLLPLLEQYEEVEEEDDEPLQIEGPEEETIHLSDAYRPHANDFLARRKLFVGISGSGKSNTTAVTCEELGRLNVPMILADTENEYETLCDKRHLPNGMLVDSRTVSVENAVQFGRHVLENNIQAIVNLHSYEMPEAAQLMVNLIAGMKEWQEERENERRIPCEFILEEATTWLPQNVKESPLNGTEVFNLLQGAFFNDMVRKGRKRGLGLTVICQKIAEIDKRVLQSELKILHRQGEMLDLEKYKKMGISYEETLSLQNGECFLFSSGIYKLRLQIRQRHTEHGANTPDLGALRKHQKVRNPLENARNFGEKEQANGDFFRTGFEPPVEPIQWQNFDNSESSNLRKTTVQKGVPETTKTAILDLYREGKKRKDIQGILDLNGDEYWMVKAVCDEHDREGED